MTLSRLNRSTRQRSRWPVKAAKCKGVPERTSSTVRSFLGVFQRLEEFLGKRRQCNIYTIYNNTKRIQKVCLWKGDLKKWKTEPYPSHLSLHTWDSRFWDVLVTFTQITSTWKHRCILLFLLPTQQISYSESTLINVQPLHRTLNGARARARGAAGKRAECLRLAPLHLEILKEWRWWNLKIQWKKNDFLSSLPALEHGFRKMWQEKNANKKTWIHGILGREKSSKGPKGPNDLAASQVFEKIGKIAQKDPKENIGRAVLWIVKVTSAGFCHLLSWMFEQTSMMMGKKQWPKATVDGENPGDG